MQERDYNALRYSPNSGQPVSRDKQLQDNILAAVRNREFFICLQPKFAFPERKIIGAEVLLRWNAPNDGIIFPAEFLSAARSAGLIELLDLYALNDACACLRKWIDAEAQAVPFSINISSSALYTPGFVEAAIDTVKKHNIPPEYLEFEFSSQFIKEFPEKLGKTIAYFHSLGYSCAIDGYAQPAASLAHVFAFDIDTLKLNCRSFAPDDSRIGMESCVKTLDATKAYDKRVFCEGVETPYQLETLLAADCRLLQGYALSMPVSTRLFEKMMVRHKENKL
ncbi:EAL domain-containing protein [Christensenellaceae bacterium OttesenSCG-928-L17]|nr:EAL domain-containing protein [Christensenellaceae bacterium OttesenSCG-928-L17]